LSPSNENPSASEAHSAADGERFCDQATGRRWKLPLSSRLTWYILAFGLVSGLVYLMATASTGPTDPSEATRGSMSHGTAVFNSSMIVFREGLEAVLILAAVTASLRGANLVHRRPVFLGAVAAFGASVLTWIAAGEVLLGVVAGRPVPPQPRDQPAEAALAFRQLVEQKVPAHLQLSCGQGQRSD